MSRRMSRRLELFSLGSGPPFLSAPAWGLVLVLSAAGLTGCGQNESEATPAPTPVADRAVTVATRLIESQSIIDEATLPAELHAHRRAVLAAEIPGTLDAIHVEEGQRVAAGQTLVAIDTRSLKQRLAEAQAVERQRRLQFERAQALLERRSITQMQFLDAQTARDVAEAQLASAQLDLEKSKVTAPWAGTIAVVHPEVGDYVSPGQGLLELVDTATLEVRATAPSSDVPFLKTGQTARVEVDVFPGEIFEGEIVRLATELDPSSRTLEAVVEIANPDGRLRPGLAARVRVARRELDDAVLAPLAAVVELEQGHVVYVAEGDRAAQRKILLGPVIGAQQVVITEGLQSGDRLIIQGQLRLSPGQKITVQDAVDQDGAPEDPATPEDPVTPEDLVAPAEG